MTPAPKPFDEIIDHHLTYQGVEPITVGHVTSYAFLRAAVEMLKQGDPRGYKVYKSIKFPEAGPTEESRREAYIYAVERAGEIAVAHYSRALTKSPNSAC